MCIWRSRPRRVVHHDSMDRPQRGRTGRAASGRRAVSRTPGCEGQGGQPISRNEARNVARLRTLLCLVWLLLAVSPAAAQDNTNQRIDALGSEPQPRGQWRVGAFVGGAHKSPINPLLGQTPDRDHLFVGLQAQTTVLKIGGSRFSWGVQFLPVVVVKGRSAPLGYHGPVDDEGLIPGDDTAYAFGFSPFALEYAVPLGGRLAIFGAAA